MYRSYFYGLLVVGAVVAGAIGFLGGGNPDEITVLSARTPEPVANTVHASTIPTEPATTLTTIRLAEPDDGSNYRPTTTTSPPPTTAAAPPTTQAPAEQPAETQPKKQAPPPPAAGGFNAEFESAFGSSINSYRSSSGLSGLSRDGTLDAEARAWAKAMADQGVISHSNLGRFMPPWSAVAENVGSGGSVSSLFGALTASSGHRSNMLGGYTHFGIGVWIDGSGTLWTAHVFTG